MDIQNMIDEYLLWLKSEITFEKMGEYYEITTPYLDSANDYLQIYVKQDGNEIFFSDDCAIMHGLQMTGFNMSANRKDNLQRILYQYGVQIQGEELVAKASVDEFARKKHMFIQAMMRIDDMFTTPKSKVEPIFLENIRGFFAASDIFCMDNVQFKGRSGFEHSYDFAFQRSKTKPERLCKALNQPKKSNVGSILWAWEDTKLTRASDSKLIVILNDAEGISAGIEDAFLNYQADVIKWSERKNANNIALLTA